MTTIGDRIKEVRGARSTREFAEIIGVTNAIVSLWENGHRNVPESKILQIAKTFSVREEWLRTGEGEPFIEKTKDQLIQEMVDEIMATKPEDFRRRFVRALTVLDADGWRALERFIDQLSERKEEPFESPPAAGGSDLTPEEKELVRQFREKKNQAGRLEVSSAG